MIDHSAEHFEKSPDTLLNISKKIQEGYRDFAKKFVKFPAFPKKRRFKTYLPMPDRPKDFAGLSGKWPAKLSDFLKIVRKSQRTFLKKFHKVIGLF